MSHRYRDRQGAIRQIEANAQRETESTGILSPGQKAAGLMAWKNGRRSQGCASSALGFILPPAQKRAGLMA
jgi:hypothetical protein